MVDDVGVPCLDEGDHRAARRQPDARRHRVVAHARPGLVEVALAIRDQRARARHIARRGPRHHRVHIVEHVERRIDLRAPRGGQRLPPRGLVVPFHREPPEERGGIEQLEGESRRRRVVDARVVDAAHGLHVPRLEREQGVVPPVVHRERVALAPRRLALLEEAEAEVDPRAHLEAVRDGVDAPHVARVAVHRAPPHLLRALVVASLLEAEREHAESGA